MARLTGLDELKSTGGLQLLKEVYAGMIENVQKSTLANLIKNTNLSGDPMAGSVVAKRIENTESKAYGTARSGGAGQTIESSEVSIQLNTDKELINEAEQKDLKMNTVDGLIAKKSAQNGKSMERELDRAFFAVAESNATEVFTAETDIAKIFNAVVKPLKTLQNDFIDGVDADDIWVTMDTDRYDLIRDKVDSLDNANVTSDIASLGKYHGIKVAENIRQSAQFIVMMQGAVAQPISVDLDSPDKFPASNAWHFGMFYSYGTAPVMADTIFVKYGYTITADVALDEDKTYYTKSGAVYTAVETPDVANIATYYERD